jgi:hypothetical protein
MASGFELGDIVVVTREEEIDGMVFGKRTVVNALAAEAPSQQTLRLCVALWKRVVAGERGMHVVTVTQRAVQVEGREQAHPWARAVWARAVWARAVCALGRCVTAECKGCWMGLEFAGPW